MPAQPSQRKTNRLLDALLTREPHQRLRLVHTGLASLLMAAAVGLMHYMTAAGLNDGRGLWAWTVGALAGVTGMFLVVRSGWTQRLRDPSFTMPQMLCAIAFAAAAYAIAGKGQGVALVMLTVALMFGVFGMSRRNAWLIAIYTLLVFGGVMLWCARTDPEVYPPAVQLAHFAMTGIFVVGLSAVAARLGAMRARMRGQQTELAAALDRISQMASLDELTGLPNRRRMGELLVAERERTLRSGHAWNVAVLDIDHFKRVNDSFGHAAGDAVLRAVAAVGTSTIRRCDALARWGGEEFVLLLRDVDLGGASAVATRLLQALERSDISADGHSLRVTASIGVAAHRPGESIEDTVARADRALYTAKQGGRNRVVTEVSVPASSEACETRPRPAPTPIG